MDLMDKSSPEYAITMLMSRPNLPRNIKLQPEAKECIRFADKMRGHVSYGRYNGVWVHLPNESKRGIIMNLLLLAMGMIRGAADYLFLWRGGNCAIELKTPERHGWRRGKWAKIKKTAQSEYQGYFQKWCEFCGVPYYVCYTAEEAEKILINLGALTLSNPVTGR